MAVCAVALGQAQQPPTIWFRPRDPIRTAPDAGSVDYFDLFSPSAPW
jgi:hypothetical protein